MKRLDWLLFGSAWLALVAAASGCGGDPFTPGSGGAGAGTGGGTTSPTSSAGGSGGGGEAASSSSSGAGGCKQDGDCPMPSSSGQCPQIAKCESGTCELKFVAGPANSQKYGDCLQALCDDQGKVSMVAKDGDVYDDGNDCTDDLCQGGKPINPTKANYQCGGDGSLCAIPGGGSYPTCFECNPAGANTCPAVNVCAKGKCVPLHCQSGVKDFGESGLDCGGLECNPCMSGGDCSTHLDCLSDVCIAGKCATPSCSDAKTNGAETDEDCGGNCPPCKDNLHCNYPGDCKSQVCIGNVCKAPECTDGVMNGVETGIDCGGSCPPCP